MKLHSDQRRRNRDLQVTEDEENKLVTRVGNKMKKWGPGLAYFLSSLHPVAAKVIEKKCGPETAQHSLAKLQPR